MRAIGTEFWHTYGQDKHCSSGEQRKFLYRVVAHDDCARFIGDEDGFKAERVETVRIMVRYPVAVKQVQQTDGLWHWEPMFGEWQELLA